MKPTIIISTYPNKKTINKIAIDLVKNKTIACVNYFEIQSVYSWEGKIEKQPEYLAIFKTTQKNKKNLQKILKSTHPYKVPEIIEVNPLSINDSYLKWLIDKTN
jgi:periplasmic divalent cation tolerance protein